MNDFPQDRLYYIPLTAECLPGCSLCAELGCREGVDRDWEAVLRALGRAARAECTEILFPAGLLKHARRHEILSLCREKGFRNSLQLSVSAFRQLSSPLRGELQEMLRAGLGLELVATGEEGRLGEEFRELLSSCRFVLLGLRGAPIWPFLESLTALTGAVPGGFGLQFAFPPYSARPDRLLSAREVYALLRRVRDGFPHLRILPLRGRDVWDPRIPRDLCLEPIPEVTMEFRIEGSAPRVSVVIPAYQSGALLTNVLGHLLRQNIPRGDFEIILVNDGSTDGTPERVRNFVAPEAANLNFTLLSFPRARPRRKEEADFRAGIARNLGVKHARGQFLCFLDSDTLVPPTYLEAVLGALRDSDVVQFVRYHAKNSVAGETARYEEIQPWRDTYVLEPGYWGKFFQVKDWQALPHFWKYTCTYALALPTELFKRAGWIRRVFVYYGFEDTDLGYRLAQRGVRFRLHPLPAYHVSSERERLSGGLSPIARNKFLSRTAKIFYLNTLDPDIYVQLSSFMREEWDWKRGPRAITRWGGRLHRSLRALTAGRAL